MKVIEGIYLERKNCKWLLFMGVGSFCISMLGEWFGCWIGDIGSILGVWVFKIVFWVLIFIVKFEEIVLGNIKGFFDIGCCNGFFDIFLGY